MITEKKMIVNPVPSKTWYWLRMNERQIAVSSEVTPYVPALTVTSSSSVEDASALCSVKGGAGSGFADLVSASAAPMIFIAEDNTSRIKAVYSFNNTTTASSLGLIVPDEKEMLCIMDFTSEEAAEGMAFVQTLFTVGDRAHLTLVQIHRTADTFHLVNDMGGEIGKEGRIDLINVIISGRENDDACRFALKGDKAHAEIHTGYSAAKDHQIDFNYYIPHLGKKTTCNIEANGVLRDTARKIFRGTIDFQRGSAGAVGAERENVLLIDDTVSNQTLPVILCSEEDVEGTHGASIGKLDDALLFYLQSRGLSTEQVYEMMAAARISAVVSLIPDQETKEELDAYFERNTEE